MGIENGMDFDQQVELPLWKYKTEWESAFRKAGEVLAGEDKA